MDRPLRRVFDGGWLSTRRFQQPVNPVPVRREALLGVGTELTGMTIDVDDGLRVPHETPGHGRPSLSHRRRSGHFLRDTLYHALPALGRASTPKLPWSLPARSQPQGRPGAGLAR